MQRLTPILILLILVGGVSFNACKDAEKCSEKRMVVEAIRDNISNEPPGRTLMLRVFCNGEAEFDTYGNGKPPELKQAGLSDDDLSKIVDATRELSLEPRVTNYPAKLRSTDSFITVTLTYDPGTGPQTIVMREADHSIHIDTLESPALRKLMWLITNANTKLRLGKPSTN